MSNAYTVTVELSFAVSAARAARVLEAWRVQRERRKAYMRSYRRKPKQVPSP